MLLPAIHCHLACYSSNILLCCKVVDFDLRNKLASVAAICYAFCFTVWQLKDQTVNGANKSNIYSEIIHICWAHSKATYCEAFSQNSMQFILSLKLNSILFNLFAACRLYIAYTGHVSIVFVWLSIRTDTGHNRNAMGCWRLANRGNACQVNECKTI